MNLLVARLRLRWLRLRRWVKVTPTLLVPQGQIILEHIRKEGFDEEPLLAALREHGVSEIAEVEMAVLEFELFEKSLGLGVVHP